MAICPDSFDELYDVNQQGAVEEIILLRGVVVCGRTTLALSK